MLGSTSFSAGFALRKPDLKIPGWAISRLFRFTLLALATAFSLKAQAYGLTCSELFEARFENELVSTPARALMVLRLPEVLPAGRYAVKVLSADGKSSHQRVLHVSRIDQTGGIQISLSSHLGTSARLNYEHLIMANAGIHSKQQDRPVKMRVQRPAPNVIVISNLSQRHIRQQVSAAQLTRAPITVNTNTNSGPGANHGEVTRHTELVITENSDKSISMVYSEYNRTQSSYSANHGFVTTMKIEIPASERYAVVQRAVVESERAAANAAAAKLQN